MLVESFVGITKKVTTYRSETNGIAEKTVRRVKECTSALLVQSGLSEYGWREAMELFLLFAKRTMPTEIRSNDFGLLFSRFKFEFCRRGNYFKKPIRI